MSKNFQNELNEMYRLMNYGMDENKKAVDVKPILEYTQKGADGKTYGILREGTKYYVEVAPKKDTAVLTEDFDYLGGFNNRKSYDSYTKASNALNLQLISVNEACNAKKNVSQYKLNESAEWQTPMTKEARQELNRFYELCENVDKLLDKNIHYIKENKNNPFTDKPSTKDGGGYKTTPGTAVNPKISNTDFVEGGTKNVEKMRSQYQDGKGEFSNKNYGFGDSNVDEDGGVAYQEKPHTPDMKEGRVRRSVKLSEEQQKQVLAWRDDRAFVHHSSDSELDRSHGTEIGDTAPYTDNVNENFETTEWDDGLPGTPGVGDAKNYKEPFANQKGVRQPVSEQYIFEVEMDDNSAMMDGDFDENGNMTADMFGGDQDVADSANDVMDYGMNGTEDEFDDAIYNHLDNYGEGSDSLGVDVDNDPTLEDIPTDDNGDQTDYELELDDNDAMGDDSQMMNEGTVLNDFGRHPAYRKHPMTLPPNADGSKWGEDWNDESAKGDEPYGKQIGHGGDPFTEKVDAITNALVTALSKKKD